MMKSLLLLTFFLTFLTLHASAQFGIKKKTKSADGKSATYEEDQIIDFDNDPELKQAIQDFANMSPEEMKETILELKEEMKDDPESLAELDRVLNLISKMDAKEMEENIKAIMEEEDVARSMADTLQLLHKSGDEAWEKIIKHKDAILDSVIQLGVMSEDEIKLFKSDEAAWEEELKHIWGEMKAVADADVDARDEL